MRKLLLTLVALGATLGAIPLAHASSEGRDDWHWRHHREWRQGAAERHWHHCHRHWSHWHRRWQCD